MSSLRLPWATHTYTNTIADELRIKRSVHHVRRDSRKFTHVCWAAFKALPDACSRWAAGWTRSGGDPVTQEVPGGRRLPAGVGLTVQQSAWVPGVLVHRRATGDLLNVPVNMRRARSTGFRKGGLPDSELMCDGLVRKQTSQEEAVVSTQGAQPPLCGGGTSSRSLFPQREVLTHAVGHRLLRPVFDHVSAKKRWV